jgi:biopolymer transport protein ExbB
VIELLIKGGPVMVPIVLCSIVAFAVFLERLAALRRERVVPASTCAEVIERVRLGRVDEALALCRSRPSAATRLYEAAIEARVLGRERVRERMEEVGRREVSELERYTAVLGTVAAVGPMLGLLGTVQGMINTFEVIEAGGIGDMSQLAGGISVALITTFGGLVVGIPALVADRYVLSRVDDLTLDLEEAGAAMAELLDHLGRRL